MRWQDTSPAWLVGPRIVRVKAGSMYVHGLYKPLQHELSVTLKDRHLEAYKYTKTAVVLDSEWYSSLDQFAEYALDLLDDRDIQRGFGDTNDDTVVTLVLPACYGE